MAAKLVAEEGSLKGLVLSLEDGDHWVIGRDPDACQLLVEDPSASRKHLICRTTPKGILVENLSETNPVQVNDEEVKEPRLLQNGDAVKIGSGTFRFYAESAAQLVPNSKQEGEKPKQENDNIPAIQKEKTEDQTKEKTPIVKNDSQKEEKTADQTVEEVEENPPKEVKYQEVKEKSVPLSQESAPPAAQEEEKKDEARDAEIEDAIEEAQPPKEESAAQVEKEPVKTEQEKPNVEEQKPIQGPMETATKESTEEETTPAAMPDAEEIPAAASQSSAQPQPTRQPEEGAPIQPLATPTHEEEPRHDSVYEDEPSESHSLAEINFGLLDTGRWLLKVISGPNNGAEFSMQTGSSYVVGTDPHACDIVFHDTSVSRQHARITVSQEDVLSIEDLKSRNGTMVDGQPLKGKQPLTPNTLVAVGTTSFIVFDREGEMQTIISPLMPSIVKVLQTEESKKTGETPSDATPTLATAEFKEEEEHTHPTTTIGAFILIGILTGLFVIVGIGTSTLFRSEPVAVTQTVDPYKVLETALAPFPNVKFTFNQNTGQLLLVGHVLSTTDKSQLMYTLQGLSFIKSLDDSSVVIDEYVWREINQVLEKNPDWKGINVMSTSPGHFIVSGYLQTRAQADRLDEYLNANFPYPDLLDKKIIVDQEVLASVNSILQSKGLKALTTKLDNGEVTISGGVPTGKMEDFTASVAEIKEIRGVRSVRNLTTGMAPEQSIVNISDKYEVTGISSQAGNLSVVINGRILMKGDALDGMTITTIQPNVIYLEKEGTKYKIEFSH